MHICSRGRTNFVRATQITTPNLAIQAANTQTTKGKMSYPYKDMAQKMLSGSLIGLLAGAAYTGISQTISTGCVNCGNTLVNLTIGAVLGLVAAAASN